MHCCTAVLLCEVVDLGSTSKHVVYRGRPPVCLEVSELKSADFVSWGDGTSMMPDNKERKASVPKRDKNETVMENSPTFAESQPFGMSGFDRAVRLCLIRSHCHRT